MRSWVILCLVFVFAVTVSSERASANQTFTVNYTNPAWDGEDVFVHYGFDGWNYITSGEGAGSDVILGNVNYFYRRKMNPLDATGGFSADLYIPANVKALHYVFCKGECSSGAWDNNDGKDYAAPIAYPYVGPILTLNHRASPATGIVISFESGDGPHRGWLEIGKIGEATRLVMANHSTRMHRFALSGLSPDTEYRYRVGNAAGRRSEWFQFRTLKENDAQLSFVLFGDTQDDGERQSGSVLNAIVRDHADVDFLLTTGDLPWNNHPGEWWSFFSKAKKLLASKAIVAAIGNHDTPGNNSHRDSSSFRYYFYQDYQLQDRAVVNSQIGPARFLLLNSELPNDFVKERGVQYRWLENILNQPTSAQWNFVLWHIPPFNAGARHSGRQREFQHTMELAAEKIDWHFAGHEHLYQRMLPLVQEDGRTESRAYYGTSPGGGVGHIVVPSAGVNPNRSLIREGSRVFNRSFLEFPSVPLHQTQVEGTLGFIRIDLDGDEFQLRTYDVDPSDGTARVIDRVQYQKSER